MSEIRLKVDYLDGKSIGYSSETEFHVEVGKGKGAYKVRYTVIGNLSRAVGFYNAINVANGYKKRLSMGDRVLVRHISQGDTP